MRTRTEIDARIVGLLAEAKATQDGLELIVLMAEINTLRWVLGLERILPSAERMAE